MRMTDQHGNQVAPIVLDGVPGFRVTDRHGYLLGGYQHGHPTTPADLVALGVDLATLVDAQPAAA